MSQVKKSKNEAPKKVEALKVPQPPKRKDLSNSDSDSMGEDHAWPSDFNNDPDSDSDFLDALGNMDMKGEEVEEIWTHLNAVYKNLKK